MTPLRPADTFRDEDARAIQLTAEIEQLVQSRVDSGRYSSADEVVREALDLLEIEERDRESKRKRFREKIARAIEQDDRGESVDGEAFMTKFLADMDLEMPPVK